MIIAQYSVTCDSNSSSRRNTMAPMTGPNSEPMVDQSFDRPGFTSVLGLKDIKLALAAGELANVPLPSGSIVRDRLIGAIAHGDADKDWAVLAREQGRACGLDS